MDGILNVFKPVGMTSFDVVALVRKWAGTRSVGHTGTLDPDATGVLTVCIGTATKVVETLTGKVKCYRAELCLGIETETQDAGGNITATAPPATDFEVIKAAVAKMQGECHQVPPMYSSIKINGKKLYELARKGETIHREPRKVEIYRCEAISFRSAEGCMNVLIEVVCSKGTYIRTLCHDIGAALGCGGHMSFLLRKSNGRYTADMAHSLEDLADAHSRGEFAALLLPADDAFSSLPSFYADNTAAEKLLSGQIVLLDLETLSLDPNQLSFESFLENPSAGKETRVYSYYGFLGLARVQMDMECRKTAAIKMTRQMVAKRIRDNINGLGLQ